MARTAENNATQKQNGRARMKPNTKGTKAGSLEEVGIEPYENLANAIVKQAVLDYKEQLHLLLNNPNSCDAMREAMRIEKFFRSGWYTSLTSLDSEKLINGVRILVRKEAAEEAQKGLLAKERTYRKKAAMLRNEEPVLDATGGKEYAREKSACRVTELEQKADALKAEAAGKKAEAEELERQSIKAAGFMVREPKQKGRS